MSDVTNLPRYAWQTKEVSEHAYDRGGIIGADPRMGKTLTAVDNLTVVNSAELPTLVVCPLVTRSVWQSHLHAAGMGNVLVLNYDKLKSRLKELEKLKPRFVIVDESHLIKGVSTDRSRIVRHLAQRADWVRCLSGTPAPNGWQDLWSQLSACDVNEWGKFYGPYRDRYIICDSTYHSRVLSYRNVEELQERLKPYLRSYRRADVFGPDSWQESICSVQLPPAARKVYDRVATEFIDDELGIDATHTLARMTILHQLAGGWYNGCELHSAKVNQIADDACQIMDSGERCVIFHRFEGEGAALLHQVALRAKSRYALGRISGVTSEKARAALIHAINNGRKPACLIVQIASGGIGIDLSNVQHALFASLTFSYAEYRQARDRIYKPGESRCVTNYVAERTIDGMLLKVLKRKAELHNILQMYGREEIAFGNSGEA